MKSEREGESEREYGEERVDSTAKEVRFQGEERGQTKKQEHEAVLRVQREKIQNGQRGEVKGGA